MRTLTLRIYLTVVAVLLLFAFGSGWLFQRQIEQERQNTESAVSDRMAAWGDLIQRSLPGIDAPVADQSAALLDWSQRLRVPLALDDVQGKRIVASESFLRRQAEGAGGRQFSIALDDGRTLWVMRPGLRKGMRGPPGTGPRDGADRGLPGPDTPFVPASWQRGIGPVVVLVLLFIAVAAGAWPAVRHLTRRLQALKNGVEQFGAGELHHRVEVSGRDEVAAVAASFNLAAERIETLVRSHQSLLANASHELRSPLARMKMAVSMLDNASPEQTQRLKREIDTNVAELDALVEEVLLASRLDAVQRVDRRDPVDLLALAAEEGARVDAAVDGTSVTVPGDERLLRRALRNLLENARRYAGDDVVVLVAANGNQASVQVCDRGPGVPEAQRERIFEAFYRLPGHAEQAGGVGLGLSLVKQIAERHGGSVRCTAREGGGSCFELRFPVA
jgi:signal transduction histidine kinase